MRAHKRNYCMKKRKILWNLQSFRINNRVRFNLPWTLAKRLNKAMVKTGKQNTSMKKWFWLGLNDEFKFLLLYCQCLLILNRWCCPFLCCFCAAAIATGCGHFGTFNKSHKITTKLNWNILSIISFVAIFCGAAVVCFNCSNILFWAHIIHIIVYEMVWKILA